MSKRDAALDEFLGVPTRTRLQRWRRWIVLAIVLAVLLALLGIWLASRSAPVQYATAEVERGDMRVTVTATGNLAPTNQVTVGSELSGLVTDVLVDVNDPVEAGAPLARLDRQRLEDAIRRSAAALSSARAGVAQAQATVDETAAALRRQQEVHRLSGGRVPSAAELDSARAAQARARANLATARAQVESADAQLSSDRINLDKSTIRSPVDGVVLARNVEPGQTVAASFSAPELFVIAEDLSSMEAKVKVDEADVGQVRAGQPATFTVDAWPGRTFPAEIKRVDYGANSASEAGGMASASTVVSYNAVLSVANPDGILRPGMTATATLVTSEERDVLLVPNAALRYAPSTPAAAAPGGSFMSLPRRQRPRSEGEPSIGRGSQQTVHVLQDGRPQPLPVTVGASNGTVTIVTDGELREGMRLVVGELAGQRR